MSSNFTVRAILALPGISERELRVLMVLETVTADKDGWREVGAVLLARYARMSVGTAARARGKLAGRGLIEYVRGDGQGHLSAYRLRIPASAAEAVRQAAAEETRRAARHPKRREGGPNAGDLEGSPNAGDLGDLEGSPNAGDLEGGPNAGDLEGGHEAPGRWSDTPREGSHRNPATSDDENGVLYPSVLKPLVPRAPARAPAHARDLDGHAEGAWSGQGDDDDFDYETRPRRSPGLGQCTACGGWFLAAALGRINRHNDPADWSRTCPGAGQPPVRPVRCTGPCGRTGLALASLTGLCAACTRERKEAEAEGRPWP
jgi:hypothetical protein